MNDKIISISLTIDQAIVLGELFNRSDDEGKLRIICTAEYLALQKIATQIDKTLTEPFAANYHEILAASRIRIENGHQGCTPWSTL